ncbi:Phosphonoacetate hydrolase [Mollisia scopiformis]|uniref:Phosphonoacetate hydrolase n=1 Tax=Mollisia scopiformis TaxID=149040 RepID=A0A194X5U9_MOLSC|nr:Phosphonoacetate hydrolase [Mollisia scopiformis]KUJ15172.1 Phosphonoacetate hydrolase [Mollisia scopiformis]
MSNTNGVPRSIEFYGRSYRLPRQPTVIVCVDGFDPEYLERGCADGILPNFSRFLESGFHVTAKCAMPSLTNPNNVSIITGVPTSVHDISGNFYLDKVTGEEHMVLDDSLLRGSTILEQMANNGVRVAAITAKDKLRKILNHGLSPSKGAICFSAQAAKSCTDAEHGISNVEKWLGRPAPEQYSGDLSIYVLDAGLKLLQENRADLFYLTLSDFIQHKYAPGSPESDDFLQLLDHRLGKFDELGAIVAITGDHGMSDKSNEDGSPNILFLETELMAKWPKCSARVICPIADPFVKHHGALGSFVRVHLLGELGTNDIEDMVQYCHSLSQVKAAYTGAEAATVFEMPPDREGDLVVVSEKNAVIGSREDEHDLSQLQGFRLRSHGGVSEERIPLIRSTPLCGRERVEPHVWRNFDVFDVALNF